MGYAPADRVFQDSGRCNPNAKIDSIDFPSAVLPNSDGEDTADVDQQPVAIPAKIAEKSGKEQDVDSVENPQAIKTGRRSGRQTKKETISAPSVVDELETKRVCREYIQIEKRWHKARKDCGTAHKKVTDLIKRQQNGERFTGSLKTQFTRNKNILVRTSDQLKCLESEIFDYSSAHNIERPPMAPELDAAMTLRKQCELLGASSQKQSCSESQATEQPLTAHAFIDKQLGQIQDTQPQNESNQRPKSEDELMTQRAPVRLTRASASMQAHAHRAPMPGIQSPATKGADIGTSPILCSQQSPEKNETNSDVPEHYLPRTLPQTHGDDADDEVSTSIEPSALQSLSKSVTPLEKLLLGQLQNQSEEQPVVRSSRTSLAVETLPQSDAQLENISVLEEKSISQLPAESSRRYRPAQASQAGSETSDDSDEDEAVDDEDDVKNESAESSACDSGESERLEDESDDIEEAPPQIVGPDGASKAMDEEEDIQKDAEEHASNGSKSLSLARSRSTSIDSKSSSQESEDADPVGTFRKEHPASVPDESKAKDSVNGSQPSVVAEDETMKARSSGLFSCFSFFHSARNLKPNAVFSSTQPAHFSHDGSTSSGDVSRSLMNTSLSQPVGIASSPASPRKLPTFSAPRLTQLNTSSLMRRQYGRGSAGGGSTGSGRTSTLPFMTPARMLPSDQQALSRRADGDAAADRTDRDELDAESDSESEDETDSDSDSFDGDKGKPSKSSQQASSIVPASKQASAAAAAAAKRNRKSRALDELF